MTLNALLLTAAVLCQAVSVLEVCALAASLLILLEGGR